MVDIRLIHQRMTAAGIPLESIRDTDGTLAGLQLIFGSTVTEQQKIDAQTIVNAYTDIDGLSLSDIRARWQASALHGKTPAQIFTTMQNQIDGWSTLAQAKADLRVWLPMLFAALAWTVFREQQRD